MSKARSRSVAIIGTRGYPSYYGGFETAVRHLAPYLAERGWEVTVYGRPGAVEEKDAARDPRVRSRYTHGIRLSSLSTLSYGLTSTLHTVVRRPDAALVMNVANGYWLPILRARGIPTVVNVDGIEWERDKWSRLGKAVFRTGARMTARWATRLVYDAHAIGDRWARDFGTTGTFIPYGGDEAGELPVEPGLTSGDYALVVARFVPENTIDAFFDAATIVGRTHDVVIVGSSGYGGEFDERAKRLAQSNARVHWLGHIHDDRRLHALWQHAGAYFHGHSVGGTNPALVQAMACGAPTVARDTVYNREVLGTEGLFVAPEPAAIAEAMTHLLASPGERTRLSSGARTRAREHYTWNSVCAAYEQTLLDAIGASPARGKARR